MTDNTMVDEYRITDSLASIAAQMNTTDAGKQAEAVENLRWLLGALPTSFVTADESLSLQALALSIADLLATRLQEDEEAMGLLLIMRNVMRSAATYAECMGGASLEDHAFFEREAFVNFDLQPVDGDIVRRIVHMPKDCHADQMPAARLLETRRPFLASSPPEQR